MGCVSPILIKSPLASHNKSHIYVPCGKCSFCARTKRNEWFLRLKHESRDHQFTKFITLTYSDENMPFYLNEETGEFYYTPLKRDIQLFLKRLRKKHKLRYFIVSEMAPVTLRPHYHGILFSDDNITDNILRDSWQLGVTDCQDASDATMLYTTKYLLKGADRYNQIKLQSTRPGLGRSYVNKQKIYQMYYKDENGIYRHRCHDNGKFHPLPRYYRKLIKDMIDPLDYSINQIKVISEMEIKSQFEQYEKKFDFISDPLVRQSKTLESIYYKNYKDMENQFLINNKEFNLWI